MIKTIRKLSYPEVFNSLTHGFGVLLSIAALLTLVIPAATKPYGDVWKVVSFSIYGVSMFMLYLASMLYHLQVDQQKKQIMKLIDHSAIYLLIAGTYTPFALVTLRGVWGWIILVLIWGLALTGLIFKLFFYSDRYRRLNAWLYVGMGWVAVTAIKPLMENLPAGGLFWLVTGGLFYTGGVFFYLRQSNPWNHVIWHLFVLAGSLAHFAAVYGYVLPA